MLECGSCAGQGVLGIGDAAVGTMDGASGTLRVDPGKTGTLGRTMGNLWDAFMQQNVDE